MAAMVRWNRIWRRNTISFGSEVKLSPPSSSKALRHGPGLLTLRKGSRFSKPSAWGNFFLSPAWSTRSTTGCGARSTFLPPPFPQQLSRDGHWHGSGMSLVTRHTSLVTRHTSHVTRHTSLVTRHTPHVTRHTSLATCHTSLVTRHSSHVTRHSSHVTRHTSHATRHSSHVTRHSSHVTRHTSHVTRHSSLATTASLEPSFRAPRKVGDAVVGRGNAEWTTSKSCAMPELLTVAYCEKDWKRISVELSVMLPPTRKLVKGLKWTAHCSSV